MTFLTGLAAASAAAVAFGVQYVPVKKHKIFDGTTFQWFMCSGILSVGLISAMITGDIQRGSPLLVMFGGALWALSNFAVLPLVKLLGIGLGFSLYHFVNMVVGYCTGRWGVFGVPPLKEVFPHSLYLCDFGCVLILISFVAMLFVETNEDRYERPLPPAIVEGIDSKYREDYNHWRRGNARGCRDMRVSSLLGDPENDDSVLGASLSRGAGVYSSGGFSMHGGLKSARQGTPEAAAVEEEIRGAASGGGRSRPLLAVAEARQAASPELGALPSPSGMPPPLGTSIFQRSVSEPTLRIAIPLDLPRPPSASVRYRKMFLGAILALVGGGLAGIQSVPATLYNVAHAHDPPTAVVFPQCLGIWGCSTAIYVVYSSVARLQRWPVPHSVIRPAFFSGCIWAVGFMLMIVGIRELGYSIGYTLDAVGPIGVSSLLSIFWFKEITTRRQLVVYLGAELLQVAGVLLITAYGKQ